MRSIVVYYSKTGNTKAIAEIIAKGLECDVYSVNLIGKKGRGTKDERDIEKELYSTALLHSVGCDLVIVGTPTGFQKAKSMIQRYVRDVQADAVALFCTYNNKIGTTLTDLENTLTEREIEVIHTFSLGMIKPGEFGHLEESVKKVLIEQVNEYIELCKAYLDGRTMS